MNSQFRLSNQRKSREVKRGGPNNNNNNNVNGKRSGKPNNNVKFSNINNYTPDISGPNSGINRNNNRYGNDNDTIKPSKYGTYITSPKNTPKNRNNRVIANNSNSHLATPNTNNNNFSPINTPPRLRSMNQQADNNHTFSASSQNILPGISPYTSARNNEIPNLESWGITNQPRNEDMYSLYRYNPSPLINHNLIPAYNQNSYLNKERKVIIAIACNLVFKFFLFFF